MSNAIILHGLPDKEEYFNPSTPSPSNNHWFPWIQKQLLINGIKADTPEIPNAFEADYSAFKREVERFDINKDTILIGHSMGAGFWVRYLSDNPKIKVSKIVLVAPWLNTQKEVDTDFFDFTLRKEFMSQADHVVIFNSVDDFKEIQQTVDYLLKNFPGINVREFNGFGHFSLEEMGKEDFPELLEEVLLDVRD